MTTLRQLWVDSNTGQRAMIVLFIALSIVLIPLAINSLYPFEL